MTLTIDDVKRAVEEFQITITEIVDDIILGDAGWFVSHLTETKYWELITALVEHRGIFKSEE